MSLSLSPEVEVVQIPKAELDSLAEFAKTCHQYAGLCKSQNERLMLMLNESDRQMAALNEELSREKNHKSWFVIPASILLGIVVGKLVL